MAVERAASVSSWGGGKARAEIGPPPEPPPRPPWKVVLGLQPGRRTFPPGERRGGGVRSDPPRLILLPKPSLCFVGEQEVTGPLIAWRPRARGKVTRAAQRGRSSWALSFTLSTGSYCSFFFSQKVFAVFIAAFCFCLDR